MMRTSVFFPVNATNTQSQITPFARGHFRSRRLSPHSLNINEKNKYINHRYFRSPVIIYCYSKFSRNELRPNVAQGPRTEKSRYAHPKKKKSKTILNTILQQHGKTNNKPHCKKPIKVFFPNSRKKIIMPFVQPLMYKTHKILELFSEKRSQLRKQYTYIHDLTKLYKIKSIRRYPFVWFLIF